jgi:hypothetical protein
MQLLFGLEHCNARDENFLLELVGDDADGESLRLGHADPRPEYVGVEVDGHCYRFRLRRLQKTVTRLVPT